jgi:hypothetical protein
MPKDVSKSKLVDNMTNGTAKPGLALSGAGRTKRPYGPNQRPGNMKQPDVKMGVAKGGKPPR